jgi:hypothetical protein
MRRSTYDEMIDEWMSRCVVTEKQFIGRFRTCAVQTDFHSVVCCGYHLVQDAFQVGTNLIENGRWAKENELK